VFDAPHDPHNGAAVVRSCEAFGVQFVNVVERREAFLAAPSVSRGSEKWVDLRRFASAEDALLATRREGLELVGAHAEDLAAACTHRVRVPMRGFVESLNVSVSAAILLSYATAGRAGDLPEADRRRLYARGLYFTVDKADELLEGL
jgi:tRNA (guanosine-2'-O-)-methyltransferase